MSQGAHSRLWLTAIPQIAENSRSLEIDPDVGEEMLSLSEFFGELDLERTAIRQRAGGNYGFIAAALAPDTIAD